MFTQEIMSQIILLQTQMANTSKKEFTENKEQILLAFAAIKNFVENSEYATILNSFDSLSLSQSFKTFCKNFCDKLIALLGLNQTQAFFDWGPLQIVNFVNTELPCFFILSQLAVKCKTLIIIGANGSGKTSLANTLQQTENIVRVIPAQKMLYTNFFDIHTNKHTTTQDEYNLNIATNIYDYAHNVNQSNMNEYNIIQYTINLITKMLLAIINSHIDDKTNGISVATKFEEMQNIFRNVFDKIEIYSPRPSEKTIKAKKNSVDYDFNGLSDGERAAIFYIGTILLAPNNSYIIVDEPENHLNPAIYNKIWDILIEKRSDCQFIFISHTTDFIIARNNSEIIRIKQFLYPNEFVLESLGNSLYNIDPQYIVEVVGSRKPILYCEGSKLNEGKKITYDYRVYSVLLGDKYTIIPVENCMNVKNYTKICRSTPKVIAADAYGIIDSDMLSPDQINELQADNIFVLKTNEIEMLLVDELVVKSVIKNSIEQEIPEVEVQRRFNCFKTAVINKCAERKDKIVLSLIKADLDRIIEKKRIEDNTIEILKTSMTTYFDSYNVDDKKAEYEALLTKLIADNEYDDLIKLCNLKNEIIDGIGNTIMRDYAQQALIALKQIKNEIKNKYIPTPLH